MFPLKQRTDDYNFRVWHMLLAVVAMAVVMGLALSPFERPKQHPHSSAWDTPHQPAPAIAQTRLPQAADTKESKTLIEVLPFNMQGEVPGPLLTSILKRYLPNTTSLHADQLRDTLPPGENRRMIVILPDEQQPEL